MSCQTCGRPAEGDHQGHWLGCEETYTHSAERLAEFNRCGRDGCPEPKKEWSGKGARPKYCATGHKKEK